MVSLLSLQIIFNHAGRGTWLNQFIGCGDGQRTQWTTRQRVRWQQVQSKWAGNGETLAARAGAALLSDLIVKWTFFHLALAATRQSAFSNGQSVLSSPASTWQRSYWELKALIRTTVWLTRLHNHNLSHAWEVILDGHRRRRRDDRGLPPRRHRGRGFHRAR